MKNIISVIIVTLSLSIITNAYERIDFLMAEPKAASAILLPQEDQILGTAIVEKVLGISNNSPAHVHAQQIQHGEIVQKLTLSLLRPKGGSYHVKQTR